MDTWNELTLWDIHADRTGLIKLALLLVPDFDIGEPMVGNDSPLIGPIDDPLNLLTEASDVHYIGSTI